MPAGGVFSFLLLYRMAKAIALVDAVHRVTFASKNCGAILGGFFRDADGATGRYTDPSTMLRDPDC